MLCFFLQSDCLLHAGNAQKEDLQKKSLFTGIRGMVLIWSPLGKKSPEMISRCIYGHYRTRSSLHPLAFCQEECDEQPEHVVHLRRFAEESNLNPEALPWIRVQMEGANLREERNL